MRGVLHPNIDSAFDTGDAVPVPVDVAVEAYLGVEEAALEHALDVFRGLNP